MKRLIYTLEDSTPDGISHRVNLMLVKGWEIKQVEYVHSCGWWFGKGKYVALLTKKVPEPGDSQCGSLSIYAGPVTKRS